MPLSGLGDVGDVTEEATGLFDASGMPAEDGAFAVAAPSVAGRVEGEDTATGAAWMCGGDTCRTGVTDPIHIKDPRVTASMATLMSSERTILRRLSSEVNGTSMHIFHRFHKPFGKSRMGMDHVGHLRDRRPYLHG